MQCDAGVSCKVEEYSEPLALSTSVTVADIDALMIQANDLGVSMYTAGTLQALRTSVDDWTANAVSVLESSEVECKYLDPTLDSLLPGHCCCW
jgi:hypothetical protein